MKRALRTIGLLTAFVLALAGCSGDDDATPTTAAAPTTQATTTTTSPPPTTTSSTTTTTTSAPTTTTEAVGDMTETHAAIEAQLEIARGVSNIPEDAVAYLPDLDNPDPIVALEEAWKFENWLISVNPNPEWLRFYVLPDSPYHEETDSELANWLRNNWRVEDFSDTYYFEDAEVVELRDASIPEGVVADMPASAVAVLFTEGAGPRNVIDRESGETVGNWEAYGPDRVLTILVPTVDGWRLYYSEIGYEA